MSEIAEKTISSRRIFTGRIFRVDLDEIENPDGTQGQREVIYHNGGAAVVALDGQGAVYLVRQYRYPLRKALDELPAGKREKDEDPLVTARRELREEIGMEAGKWTSLGSSFSSPGCFSEEIFLWLAEELTPVGQRLDPDEFLTVRKVPLTQALDMVKDGRITDAKTQLALLKYAYFFR